MSPGEELLTQIRAEAETGRARLGAGAEAALEKRFADIASDLESLSRGVASGELTRPQAFSFRVDGGGEGAGGSGAGGSGAGGGGAGRRAPIGSVVARRARSVAHRGLGKARRVAGPRIRATERMAMERAARVAEDLATRRQILAERAREVGLPGPVSRRLERISPRERALPGGGESRRLRSSFAEGGDELEDWVMAQLGTAPDGLMLHVESGDGNLVRRLLVGGYEAAGADPSIEAGSGTIERAPALGYLGRRTKASVSGLVLSRFTERVTPSSARALAHLASTRLVPGGLLLVISLPPEALAADAIASDLAPRRPLHPVTWCHLLSRVGFGEVTVHDRARDDGTGGGSGLYAVVARRS